MSESAASALSFARLSELFADRIWRNGVLIVVCMVSVLLLSSQSAASYGTYLLAIAMLATVGAWKDVFEVRYLWLIGGLLLYLSLTSLWSEPFEWRELVSVLVRALLVFLFVVAVAECQLRGQVQRWLSRALALVGFVAVTAAIAVFYLTDPADGRLNGLGQLDTHVIAALVWAVLLVFAIQLLMTDRVVLWRVIGGVSAAAYVFAIALSDSRTAWVASIIGIVVFITSSRSLDVGRFVGFVSAVGAVLALAIVAATTVPAISDFLFPRGSSFRPEIWSAAWERISQDGVWFGLGILTPDDFVVDGFTMPHAHSMYLSLAYQGGVVALGLFVAVALSAFATFSRFYDDRDAKLGMSLLAIAMSAYCLDGHELIDKVGDTWFLFWLPVGLALGLAWHNLASRVADLQ